MRYYYAEINEAGIAFSVLDTYMEIKSSFFIPLDSYDKSILNKKFIGGKWEVVIKETEINVPLPPTISEKR